MTPFNLTACIPHLHFHYPNTLSADYCYRTFGFPTPDRTREPALHLFVSLLHPGEVVTFITPSSLRLVLTRDYDQVLYSYLYTRCMQIVPLPIRALRFAGSDCSRSPFCTTPLHVTLPGLPSCLLLLLISGATLPCNSPYRCLTPPPHLHARIRLEDGILPYALLPSAGLPLTPGAIVIYTAPCLLITPIPHYPLPLPHDVTLPVLLPFDLHTFLPLPFAFAFALGCIYFAFWSHLLVGKLLDNTKTS